MTRRTTAAPAAPEPPPLSRTLLLPIVVLVVLACTVAGVVAWFEQERVVQALVAGRVQEVAVRIDAMLRAQIQDRRAALDVAFPRGSTAPSDFAAEPGSMMRERLWAAAGLTPGQDQYVYFANEANQFVGLRREGPEGTARMRVRAVPAGPRTFTRLSDRTAAAVVDDVESRVFDARTRPWYRLGETLNTQQARWTPIYRSLDQGEILTTLVRALPAGPDAPAGVAATDMSLGSLSQYLRELSISPHGFAYIADENDLLVASSNQDVTVQAGAAGTQRLSATSGADTRSNAVARALAGRDDRGERGERALRVHAPDGKDLQVQTLQTHYDGDLRWRVIVAIPTDDFAPPALQRLARSAAVSLLAGGLAGWLGYAIIARMRRDVRKLLGAADQVAEGHPMPPLTLRTAEMNRVATAMTHMHDRMLTDRLTGAANREAVLRTLQDRMGGRRQVDRDRGIALLFIDLDGFKLVNDQYGHAFGDAVLKDFAQRLRRAVRSDDLVGRWSGDEFVVVLNNVHMAGDAQVARAKLQELLDIPVIIQDRGPMVVTGTVGLAVHTAQDPMSSPDQLIEAADAQMYRLKRARGADRDSRFAPLQP